MSQITRESVQDQAGLRIEIFRKKIDFFKSENNSYLLTTLSTQILHLLLAICCNHQNYGKLHKKREIRKSVQEQAGFCINICPKKPKIKKIWGKKILFLKKFKHENSHFLLANLLQIISIINTNCKTQRNTVCTRALFVHATLLSSSSFPESVIREGEINGRRLLLGFQSNGPNFPTCNQVVPRLVENAERSISYYYLVI